MFIEPNPLIAKALGRLVRKCDRCPRRPKRFACLYDRWAGDGFPDDYRLVGYCALHQPRDADYVIEISDAAVASLILWSVVRRSDAATWPVDALADCARKPDFVAFVDKLVASMRR